VNRNDTTKDEEKKEVGFIVAEKRDKENLRQICKIEKWVV
jgi:hypothetical protein